MSIEKQFSDLSDFNKRDVELFRSSDQNETAIYFTDVEDNRKSAKAYFEILRFGLDGGDHQLYVRYPNADYFIEMLGGGIGSGRGDMKKSTGKNVWLDKHKMPFTVYSHKDNLIFLIGREDWLPEFNFMTKVASYYKGNPFNRPYPNETRINYNEIEKALTMKYLKIPESIRRIEYCQKTKDTTPKYFVIDYPAYNFKYDNHRFFVVENDIIDEFEIKKFVRYRDGGTTIITVVDNSGNEHKFFSPTTFQTENICKKWDDVELLETTEKEKDELAKLLNLTLVNDISDDD